MSDVKLYFEPISGQIQQSEPEKYKVLHNLRSLLSSAYDDIPSDKADVIVALGGDGQMLAALRHAAQLRQKAQHEVKVFGIHAGDSRSKGALLNHYFKSFRQITSFKKVTELPSDLRNLNALLSLATVVDFLPLSAKGETVRKEKFSLIGFNDVAFEHQIGQEARFDLLINEKEKISFGGNGLVFATGVGSLAYNKKNGGPELSLRSQLMAVTSLATTPEFCRCFDMGTRFEITNTSPFKRVINMAVDNQTKTEIKRCVVEQSPQNIVQVLFSEHHYPQRSRL